VLDAFGTGALAKRLEGDFARVAIERGCSHFDELVGFERQLDFFHHLVGEAFGADHDHRIEIVGTAFEFLALRGTEHE